MNKNFGESLKSFAIGFGFLSSVFFLFIGVFSGSVFKTAESVEGSFFMGLIIGVIGVFTCLTAAIFIYGFGELISQTIQINQKLSGNLSSPEASYDNITKPVSSPDSIEAFTEKELTDKEKKLIEWKEKGLITEEEYTEKIKSI